jgi:glycosidase
VTSAASQAPGRSAPGPLLTRLAVPGQPTSTEAGGRRPERVPEGPGRAEPGQRTDANAVEHREQRRLYRRRAWNRINPDYRVANVAAEERDTGSVLPYFRRMIQLRKAEPVLVYGKYQLLDRENPEVFAYTRSLRERTLMVALSFSARGGRTALPAGYAPGKTLINNPPHLHCRAQSWCSSHIWRWCSN